MLRIKLYPLVHKSTVILVQILDKVQLMRSTNQEF